ncbi:hypothetical protein PGT21_021135 [Puccinia graminis f. sp. tritici]|uniref:Uncharacterized protein n=1 Tax=Puccinia graminis f. sp. tritici TaxID=56615 RepID=A0A5B0MUL4_PUCGR|nr:hypothetical protein PGT21_021135 [Puccinia graminis f. sp. tritici]
MDACKFFLILISLLAHSFLVSSQASCTKKYHLNLADCTTARNSIKFVNGDNGKGVVSQGELEIAVGRGTCMIHILNFVEGVKQPDILNAIDDILKTCAPGYDGTSQPPTFVARVTKNLIGTDPINQPKCSSTTPSVIKTEDCKVAIDRIGLDKSTGLLIQDKNFGIDSVYQTCQVRVKRVFTTIPINVNKDVLKTNVEKITTVCQNKPGSSIHISGGQVGLNGQLYIMIEKPKTA